MECIYNCVAQAGGIDWPAWVQAVGSVLGIAVAIAVPTVLSTRDHRSRQRLEEAKARTFALHMLPKVENLHRHLRTLSRLMVDENVEDADVDESQAKLKEAITPDGWGFQIHDLGEAGRLLQHSIAAAGEGLSLLEDWDFYDQWNGSIEPDGEVVELDKPANARPKISLAERLADQSIKELRSLFE